MPCVGKQGQRVGQPTTNRFHKGEDKGQPKRKSQVSAGLFPLGEFLWMYMSVMHGFGAIPVGIRFPF